MTCPGRLLPPQRMGRQGERCSDSNAMSSGEGRRSAITSRNTRLFEYMSGLSSSAALECFTERTDLSRTA